MSGPRGGSAETTSGGQCSGRSAAKNGKRPGPPVHDDLVKRDFTADDVNELWLTDITEHPTDEGKLYLCAIKDVFSGRIVGYSMRLPDEGASGSERPGERDIQASRCRWLHRRTRTADPSSGHGSSCTP